MTAANTTSTAPRRRWTAEDDARLAYYVEQGWSYRRIAGRLGRTRVAITVRAKRARVSHKHMVDVYSAREVARLFGSTDVQLVLRWIRRGWLAARNAGSRGRPQWRIDQLAILAFVDNDETWVAWAPSQIRDPELRGYAREVRTVAFPWLSVPELARRYHVSTHAATKWIRLGLLPAIQYKASYVRVADLASFVPPSQRPSTPPAACPICGKVVHSLPIHRGRIHKETHHDAYVPDPEFF